MSTCPRLRGREDLLQRRVGAPTGPLSCSYKRAEHTNSVTRSFRLCPCAFSKEAFSLSPFVSLSLPPPFSSLFFLAMFATITSFIFISLPFAASVSLNPPSSLQSQPSPWVMHLPQEGMAQWNWGSDTTRAHIQMLLDFRPIALPISACSPCIPQASLVSFLLCPVCQLALLIPAVSASQARNTPSLLFGSPHSLEGAFQKYSFVYWLMQILN